MAYTHTEAVKLCIYIILHVSNLGTSADGVCIQMFISIQMTIHRTLPSGKPIYNTNLKAMNCTIYPQVQQSNTRWLNFHIDMKARPYTAYAFKIAWFDWFFTTSTPKLGLKKSWISTVSRSPKDTIQIPIDPLDGSYGKSCYFSIRLCLVASPSYCYHHPSLSFDGMATCEPWYPACTERSSCFCTTSSSCHSIQPQQCPPSKKIDRPVWSKIYHHSI